MFGVALVVLVLVGAGAYWFLTQGPGVRITSPPGSEVLSFSDDGDARTKSFQVREGWQIQWEHDGKFTMAIDGDRDFGVAIDEEEAGSGVTSPVGEGTFFLEISADAPWQITVIQGE